MRLVYADWLEEQGDPRGEFIRTQIELEKLDETHERYWDLWIREQQLLLESATEWFPRLRLWTDRETAGSRNFKRCPTLWSAREEATLRRGFLAGVEQSSATKELLSREPIETVYTLGASQRLLQFLDANPTVTDVGTTLRSSYEDQSLDAAVELFQRQLRTLRIVNLPAAFSGRWPGLQRLSMSVRDFVSPMQCPQLASLAIEIASEPDDELQVSYARFLAELPIENLRELSLTGQAGPEVRHELASRLESIERLAVSADDLMSFILLRSSDLLPRRLNLDLHGTHASVRIRQLLAETTHLRLVGGASQSVSELLPACSSLRYLSIPRGFYSRAHGGVLRIPKACAERLCFLRAIGDELDPNIWAVQWPNLVGLTLTGLPGPLLSQMSGSSLPKLRFLRLGKLPPISRRALFKSLALPNLAVLSFSACGDLAPSGALSLVESTRSPELRYVEFKGTNRLSTVVAIRMPDGAWHVREHSNLKSPYSHP